MKILNNEEVGNFIFEHRMNGVKAIKGNFKDEPRLLPFNIKWVDMVTKEFIDIIYVDSNQNIISIGKHEYD
jgi:hypothetical protein